MLIGIDGNEANINSRVGTGQYAYQLLSALQKLDSTNQYLVYLKNPPLADMPPTNPNWKYVVIKPSKLWTRFALPLNLYFGVRPQLFFSPSHYTPIFSPIPVISSIMDLGYLHYPQQLTSKDLYQLKLWTKESILKSKYIVTISQFTKDEIVNLYHINPSKIVIAYPGVTTPKQIPHDSALPKNYFLSLGTLKPSKNIPFLIESFFQFAQKYPDYKLIISGKKGWLFNEIFSTVKKYNLENKIIFQDYITENQKWPLIKQARSLIIPSIYEGFGIPAIEAMALGTPVISSNSASLPEIIKDYGILIDPTNKSTLVKAMESIIKPLIWKKYSLLGLKRAKYFTWEKAAQNLIKVFNQV